MSAMSCGDARGADPMEHERQPTGEHGGDDRSSDGEHQSHGLGMYLRFGAMILTAMVVMYWTMFVSSWELSHVRWSQSRMFMTLTMGGTMGLIMLGWMLDMYRNKVANLVVVAASILLLAVGISLDRSQTTVQDTAFMRAMIPHHSMAITRSERAEIEDVRVCELAVEISEAQRREIAEMDWLIDDIQNNGVAATAEEAQARPIPDFGEPADRECASPAS
jgi:cytochrome c oxidase subunit IV